MSGIYGIFRCDGAPVDPQWLERMRKAMAYYGPHGGGCKIEGPAGMGHLLLEINPEDAFERQPMRCPRGLVVASVRLDNRDALLDAFDISSCEAPQVSDGHLVSLAFDRWGEEVCTHLEGDWALAAWDTKQRRLLLARDLFGMSALYYYQGKGFIAFASSMKALLALPGIPREADLLRLAEVLVSWQQDAELTAYKGFRSVIGATALIITPGGQIQERRFWSPEGREPLRYRQDHEYAEAFLERYNQAVKSCLRAKKPIAAELSGGRDSGSVVALAAPILAREGRELTAFTSVPLLSPDGARSGRVGNEWDLAHATVMMAGPNVRHIPNDASNTDVIEGMDYLLDLHDGPIHTASNLYWLKAEREICAREGIAVLLNGQMGNISVSWSGNGSALSALLHGFPRTAFRLFFQGEPNPWLTLKRQVLKPILKPGMMAFRRSMAAPRKTWQSYSALNGQMGEDLKIDLRMRDAGYDPSFAVSPLADHRKACFDQAFGTTACVSSDWSAWHSVTSLDPTANLSLFEFLLKVPDDLYYRHGRPSFLFQQAFRDRLPAQVVQGESKGQQAADLGHRVVREMPLFLECLNSIESVPEAREALDLPLLRRILDELSTEVNPDTNDRARNILAPGICVGLFFLRLAHSNSSSDCSHAN